MTDEKSQSLPSGEQTAASGAALTSSAPKILAWLVGLLGTAAVAGSVIALVISTAAVGGAAAAAASCAGSDVSGVSGSDSALPGQYRTEQIKNAKLIDAAAANLGLSGRASVIAITAAMGESSLLNLNHGDEAAGVKNPDGTSTTSKGLFQQQTSTGWGTVAQVTDPTYATTSFLTGPKHDGRAPSLVSVNGWEVREITQVIHEVQANADPNHYAQFYDAANEIIKAAGIDTSRSTDPLKQALWRSHAANPSSDPSSAGSQDSSDAGGCMGAAGRASDGTNTYPWNAPGPGVYVADPMSFFYGECTSYAGWKVNEAMGGTKTKIIFSNSYGGVTKGNAATWASAWTEAGWRVSKTPKAGSVAQWVANGAPGIGEAGHVGWVDEVLPDGTIMLSEYNNNFYAPPGHKYSRRHIKASEVNNFLYVPSSAGK